MLIISGRLELWLMGLFDDWDGVCAVMTALCRAVRTRLHNT